MGGNKCNSSESRNSSWSRPELGRANQGALLTCPCPCHIPCARLPSPSLSLGCHPSLLSPRHLGFSEQNHKTPKSHTLPPPCASYPSQ